MGASASAESGAVRPRVVEVSGLTKVREKGGARFELLVDDLGVAPGQFAAVLGRSGCGKSTLLDLLGLIMEPTSAARFRLAGDEPGGPAAVAALWARRDQAALAALRARALGYVLQTGGLLPFLTVEQNVALPLRLLGRPVDRDRVAHLLESLSIAGERRKKPGHLSGGQRQRAAIARALVHRPRLILADEPTAAVDRENAERIVTGFCAAAREQGAAVVMVTHDESLVSGVSDLVYGFRISEISEGNVRSACVLAKGRVAAEESEARA